ncbi:hypothetical protein U91I_03000 [alpha proteobacterium U9-1i]|nr:hypothetical protein U91I_03000 [alpha proteobacterium U9-1i]
MAGTFIFPVLAQIDQGRHEPNMSLQPKRCNGWNRMGDPAKVNAVARSLAKPDQAARLVTTVK